MLIPLKICKMSHRKLKIIVNFFQVFFGNVSYGLEVDLFLSFLIWNHPARSQRLESRFWQPTNKHLDKFCFSHPLVKIKRFQFFHKIIFIKSNLFKYIIYLSNNFFLTLGSWFKNTTIELLMKTIIWTALSTVTTISIILNSLKNDDELFLKQSVLELLTMLVLTYVI